MTLDDANAILVNVVADKNCRAFDVAVALVIRHLQKHLTTPTVCYRCGSWHLESFEEESETGVTGPDGQGRESRMVHGYTCLRCGAREEL